jgi:hypothetical protein
MQLDQSALLWLWQMGMLMRLATQTNTSHAAALQTVAKPSVAGPAAAKQEMAECLLPQQAADINQVNSNALGA